MTEENIEITTFSQFMSSFETLLVKALPSVIGMVRDSEFMKIGIEYSYNVSEYVFHHRKRQ